MMKICIESDGTWNGTGVEDENGKGVRCLMLSLTVHDGVEFGFMSTVDEDGQITCWEQLGEEWEPIDRMAEWPEPVDDDVKTQEAT